MLELLLSQLERHRHRLADRQSFRLLHGRGKRFAGLHWLSIDYFQPVLLFSYYDVPPLDFEESLHEKFPAIQEKFGISALLCQRRYCHDYHLQVFAGEWAGNLFARRQELKFLLAKEQQNIGYFLDIEPLRLWLDQHVMGKKVLNLFAFTCTLSVVAMAAGARSVVNMDLNKNALTRGRENHRVNNIPLQNVYFYAHNILRSWGKIKRMGLFDLVIVDPPSYQKGSFIAKSDYAKVLRRLPDILSAGGTAVLCLNAPEITVEDFKMLVVSCEQALRWQCTLVGNSDFPDIREPALKMLIYRVC